MRSYEQFEQKVLQTGIGYEKRDDRNPFEGRDQLKLMAIYRDGDLREYYEDALLDDEALIQPLKDGSVVLDRRLDDFMQAMSVPAAPTDRPDGPSTRSFVARSLGVFLELDHAQARAAELEQQDALHQAELATAGEAIQSLLDREEQTRARAAELDQELQSLLASEHELRARTTTLEHELEAHRTELAAAGEALQSLLGSRLMRWTAPFRRLRHRIHLRLTRLR